MAGQAWSEVKEKGEKSEKKGEDRGPLEERKLLGHRDHEMDLLDELQESR